MLWKCCTQYARRSGKLSSGHRSGRDQFSFQFPKKGTAKECANYYTIALIPHASKAMLKILHARIQRYVNWEISDVKARFSKGTGIRGQIANIHWIIEKAREFQNNIYFCYIDYTEAFVRITANCGKFFKRWEYQATLPTSWEICTQVKKQQLDSDIEQQTGSKLGKEFLKVLYCLLDYLTYMQSTSSKMPDWMKHELESRLPGEISITSHMQMTPHYGRKWRGTKKPLDKCERWEWKAGLKLNIKKLRSWHRVPSLHGK